MTNENGSAPRLQNTSQWIRTILRYRSEHPALRRVLDVVERLQERPYRTNAILFGEAGTGKEGLARALHALMHPNGDAPFVEAALGGRDPHEAVAELCGHGEVPGLIELARGGTLYLDEVATLSRELQARLLAALRGRVRREGDSLERTANVVVVASTDHDLQSEVAAGRFRHDLYWRLARITLMLPPLRERRADIARTAVWIGNRILLKLGVGAELSLEGEEQAGSIVLTRSACEVLERYDWPGNFRELDAVLERVLALYRTEQRVEAAHVLAALARPDEAF